MMNTLVKHLLFTCILLLSAHNILFAHTWITNYYSSAKTIESSANESFCRLQNNQIPIIKSVSSNKEKENDDLDALFIDDDEFTSFKKYLDCNNYPTSTFLNQTPNYFFSYGKKIASFYKYVSCTSSHQYIVLQVFKI